MYIQIQYFLYRSLTEETLLLVHQVVRYTRSETHQNTGTFSVLQLVLNHWIVKLKTYFTYCFKSIRCISARLLNEGAHTCMTHVRRAWSRRTFSERSRCYTNHLHQSPKTINRDNYMRQSTRFSDLSALLCFWVFMKKTE